MRYSYIYIYRETQRFRRGKVSSSDSGEKNPLCQSNRRQDACWDTGAYRDISWSIQWLKEVVMGCGVE